MTKYLFLFGFSNVGMSHYSRAEFASVQRCLVFALLLFLLLLPLFHKIKAERIETKTKTTFPESPEDLNYFGRPSVLRIEKEEENKIHVVIPGKNVNVDEGVVGVGEKLLGRSETESRGRDGSKEGTHVLMQELFSKGGGGDKPEARGRWVGGLGGGGGGGDGDSGGRKLEQAGDYLKTVIENGGGGGDGGGGGRSNVGRPEVEGLAMTWRHVDGTRDEGTRQWRRHLAGETAEEVDDSSRISSSIRGRRRVVSAFGHGGSGGGGGVDGGGGDDSDRIVSVSSTSTNRRVVPSYRHGGGGDGFDGGGGDGGGDGGGRDDSDDRIMFDSVTKRFRVKDRNVFHHDDDGGGDGSVSEIHGEVSVPLDVDREFVDDGDRGKGYPIRDLSSAVRNGAGVNAERDSTKSVASSNTSGRNGGGDGGIGDGSGGSDGSGYRNGDGRGEPGSKPAVEELMRGKGARNRAEFNTIFPEDITGEENDLEKIKMMEMHRHSDPALHRSKIYKQFVQDRVNKNKQESDNLQTRTEKRQNRQQLNIQPEMPRLHHNDVENQHIQKEKDNIFMDDGNTRKSENQENEKHIKNDNNNNNDGTNINNKNDDNDDDNIIIKYNNDDNDTNAPSPSQGHRPHQRVPRRAPPPGPATPGYTDLLANNKNIRARQEGHFIIGALFPLHQAPTQKTAYSRQCGEIREYYGIQRVETFLMTLKKINDDDSILPKIKLGWDIRDSCWYSAIALENSIDFIKDAIAGQAQTSKQDALSANHHTRSTSTTSATTANYSSSSLDNNLTFPYDDFDDDDDGDDDGVLSQTPPQLSPPSNLRSSFAIDQADGSKSTTTTTTTTKNNINKQPGPQQPSTSPTGKKRDKGEVTKCRPEETRMKPIVGLVGPGSSEATIQVQNLLQIFNIPQIGYSATSIDLSDKSHYNYFLRVVPPDRHQAQALVDVVVKFNWTYISTVHSDGNYGVRGMEKFVDLATEKGVCIATSDNVASSDEDEAFDKVLDNLMKVPNATVVVCFCEGMTVKKLLMATQRRNLEGRFLIVGSDGWGNRLDVVQGHEMAALGALSIKLYSPPVTDFLPYYTKLTPHHPSENPWFPMFWQQKFRCSLDPDKQDLRQFDRFCTGNESLLGSDQDSKLGFVVKAVETMARALHAMHQDMCPGVEGLCPAMDPIKGSVYLDYLLNVSFKSYSDELVHFDASGDPPGRYEILNYQKIFAADGNVSFDYVTIGHWMTGTLKLNGRPVHLPRLYDREVKSVCSEPCTWGQAKKVKGVACCWICTTCLDNEILIENNTDCRPCNLGWWPNANKTDCEQIVVEFIYWHDTEAVVCVTVGCIGILATLWVAAIFVRFHETPVVKASTRELSYIILAGIALAFSANFFIVAKPEQGFCYLTRIFPGLSFSLIYGALVTKTNRIARILEGSKRISTKKPRFMSATAQVIITVIIIGIECAVITGMLIYQPASSKLDYPTPKRVRLVCDTSTLGIVVPLGFDLVLILLCTIYAVKTRNLPENFNEAKFIGFTMYATCIIWSGFFPIYFAGENKEVTLSFSVSLSAAIALLLLFFPKVYVIVWVPEKNTRGAFTTSRDVRCHIGSKSLASGDSIDIKESSTFENLFKSDKGNSKQWKQKSLDEKRLRFVMQRASRSDSTSSYINHGVIRKHALLGSSCSTIIKEPSRDSARTDSTHLSGISSTCSEKDRDRVFSSGGGGGGGEAAAAVAVRQLLTSSEFTSRPPRKQSSLRPDSPAEREKHRIHNMENLPDYCLVGVGGGGIGGVGVGGGGGGGGVGSGAGRGVPTSSKSHQIPRSSQFRKSLSSNCVSMDYKTRSIHCQTEDELLQCLLPGLRRRCLAKGKHILERSTAVDATGNDEPDSTSCNKPPLTSSSLSSSSSSPPPPPPPPLHPNNDCESEFHSCTNYPHTPHCHCPPIDLSDLSPLIYEHPETNPSRYNHPHHHNRKRTPQKPKDTNNHSTTSCHNDLLNVRNFNESTTKSSPQSSHPALVDYSNTSPCNISINHHDNSMPRPSGPSPKLLHNNSCLSPLDIQCGISLTPSPDRTITTPSEFPPSPGPASATKQLSSSDCLPSVCSTVTQYHCDNPTNHFKVIKTSGIDHEHQHRRHCCCNQHHHQQNHHHPHNHQQQRHHQCSPTNPSTTTTACNYHKSQPSFTSSSTTSSSSHQIRANNQTYNAIEKHPPPLPPPPPGNDEEEESLELELPLSSSPSPSPYNHPHSHPYPYPSSPNYQHLDSCNSDSQTTLSTASSSFTLPPFNTSTDSNRSNQSMFSDTGSGGGGGGVGNDDDAVQGDRMRTMMMRTKRSNSIDDDDDDDDEEDDEESDDVIDDNEFTPLKENCDDDNDDDDDEDDEDDDDEDIGANGYSCGVVPLPSAMTDGGGGGGGNGDVMEFQNYLQARGVNLEFSSEQCSEV